MLCALWQQISFLEQFFFDEYASSLEKGAFGEYATSWYILLYVLPLPLLANTQNKLLGASVGLCYSLVLGIIKWYVGLDLTRADLT